MSTLQIIQGVGIFAVFLVMVILMMRRKISTIVALPIMAILIAAIGGVPFMSQDPEQTTIVFSVLGEGSMRMSSAIAGIIFGSFFGQVLNKTGITKGIIRKAAETAGDKPLAIALTFFAVGSIIIAASGGLGMLILIGTIMIPIMLTAGISSVTASIVMLLTVGVGAHFNVSNWAIYIDVLDIPLDTVSKYTWVSAVPLIIIGIIMIVLSTRQQGQVRKNWAMNDNYSNNNDSVRTISLISPVIPVLLVLFLSMDIVAAIIIGIIVALILSTPQRPLQIISSAFVEGIQEVAGAIALFIGIGMLLIAVMAPEVSEVLSPMIEMVIPTNAISFIVFFTLLSPLAIYRGPLNVFGLGSGIVALLVSAGMSPLASMLALRATTSLQGVSDPTNSHNVWVGDFTKVNVNTLLKKTIGWMVLAVFISVLIAAFLVY